MHACLHVDEIVRLIACELVASKAKATTVALACCHRGFENPVLDALWEIQEHLLLLLKSLPADVWNEGGQWTVSAPTTYFFPSLNYLVWKSFKRFPTPPEWARFRRYARRMRTLKQSALSGDLPLEVFSVLQLCAVNEPLFPNLKTVRLGPVAKEFISFIPLFLSPRTTNIFISFAGSSDLPKAMIASMVATFPTQCPNLHSIFLVPLPRDPMITVAISEMLLSNNRDSLRTLAVDSPLTLAAHEMIHKLPNLRELSIFVEKGTSLPPLMLPNLIGLTVEFDGDWQQMFHGATLGKLEAVSFRSTSEQIGGFLEAFERIALAASAQNTLSWFGLRTSCSWVPNYSSLHSFTQLVDLIINFPCEGGCSSTVDDDVIMDLARAMPKLETLRLGDEPCREIQTGVTAKGLAVLAHHCSDLSTLRIHFQVATLSAPPVNPGATSNVGSNALRRDCALRDLKVGKIPMPEELVLMAAVTLALIFPCIDSIDYTDGNWEKVASAIYNSRQIVNYSSKERPLFTPPSNFSDTSPGTAPENGS